MKVTVKFFTTLREIVGKPQEHIELSEVVTVSELLQQLGEKYGEKFTSFVYNGKGLVRGYLHFLINGKNITTQQGLKTKLKDNDILAILPPVGGGYDPKEENPILPPCTRLSNHILIKFPTR